MNFGFLSWGLRLGAYGGGLGFSYSDAIQDETGALIMDENGGIIRAG